MFIVEKEVEFDAAHRVPFHDSKCRNLHGHRYRVRAAVGSSDTVRPNASDSRSGMVLDFSEIKRALTEVVHDRYDHKLILWAEDPLIAGTRETPLMSALVHEDILHGGFMVVPCIPTAEELARLFFVDVDAELRKSCEPFTRGQAWLHRIDVWETPTSCASFSGAV